MPTVTGSSPARSIIASSRRDMGIGQPNLQPEPESWRCASHIRDLYKRNPSAPRVGSAQAGVS
jgi:hypothetical protein